MIFELLICAASLGFLLWVLRRKQLSLGLPLAYLGGLLLIHAPGAFAHVVGGDMLFGTEWVEEGFEYTTIGVVCFVFGVWVAQLRSRTTGRVVQVDRRSFAVFCLIGGWLVVYGLSPLGSIPSVGAAIDKAGGIWILGVLLGLRSAVKARDPQRIALWIVALSVYPTLMLVIGGFLSYGEAAVMIVIAVLAIAARQYWRAIAGIAVTVVIGLTCFVNYFEHRDDIRAEVWGGHSIEDRLATVGDMFTQFHIIDLNSTQDLTALDNRLNQNMFVGLSADRIENGEVDFLNGGTIWDGVVALVPRAFWADKPTTAGSGRIVADMTGLNLSEDTSWGVGNVMELYINFGVAGIIIGFTLLGWVLGTLDRKAAEAERRGDVRTLMLIFLPAIAMINPGGSFVEITGGSVAGLLAGYGWIWAWGAYEARKRAQRTFRPAPRELSPTEPEPLA